MRGRRPSRQCSVFRTSGEQIVEVLEPGLGEEAQFSVVEQDALHDLRLELGFSGASFCLAAACELRDQQRAGAFQLNHVVPVADPGGFRHVLTWPAQMAS